MKSFAIETLGCKVNQYESQQIRQLLEEQGLELVATNTQPELLVFNTCCVTQAASAKSRQAIRRGKKMNPNALIIVSGCLPSAPNSELASLSRDIHLIGHKNDLADKIIQLIAQGKTVIIVTHDVEFVAECNPRVILMSRGKIVADGPAKKILTNCKIVSKASIILPQIAECFLQLRDLGTPTDIIDLDEAKVALENLLREV